MDSMSRLILEITIFYHKMLLHCLKLLKGIVRYYSNHSLPKEFCNCKPLVTSFATLMALLGHPWSLLQIGSYLPHFRPSRQICLEECRHIRCQHEFSQLFYVGPGWQIGRRTSGSQLAFDHLVATPLASCPTPQSMRLFQEGIGLHTFLKSKVLLFTVTFHNSFSMKEYLRTSSKF